MSLNLSRAFALTLGLLVLAGQTLAAEPAERTEARPQAASDPNCPVDCLLSKIPYLSRLFKNVGHGESPCEACPAQVVMPRHFRVITPDGVERVGIEFECETKCCENHCTTGRCPPLRLPGEEAGVAVKCHGEAGCELAFGPPGPGQFMEMMLSAVGSQAATEVMLEAREELHEAMEDARSEFMEREHDLLEQLMEARIAAATTKVKLKAQKKLASKETALRKELLAAQLENALLAAKLEVVEEKEKLAAELRQAQLELVTLKAQVELATLKARIQSGQDAEVSARNPSEPRR